MSSAVLFKSTWCKQTFILINKESDVETEGLHNELNVSEAEPLFPTHTQNIISRVEHMYCTCEQTCYTNEWAAGCLQHVN